MSRVIIVSRFFPSYHPRKGEETYFVEKIWAGLADITDFMQPSLEMDWYEYYNGIPKWHTIRAGNRWKVGDKASLRVWSGNPYRSKQIIIAPDIEIKKKWEFKMYQNGVFSIDGRKVFSYSEYKNIATNDGLSVDDFKSWFKIKDHTKIFKKIFSGQIICWNDQIEY